MDDVRSKKELTLLKRLDTPIKVQEFIDTLEYNHSDRIAVIDVLRKSKADCLEAACLATYIFKLHNVKSFIMDLTCRGDDEDHVICVFCARGLYGAVAQSKYLGLKYRNPVYSSLRELAMSYFENYFNFQGEHDLISRSTPFKIREQWLYSAESTKMIEGKLNVRKHIVLVPKRINLPLVSKLRFRRELLIIPKWAKISRRYK